MSASTQAGRFARPRPEVDELAQPGGVLPEALFGVVAAGLHGDQERPVGGGGEQQLIQDRAPPAPRAAPADGAPGAALELGELAPDPLGVLVDPDAVVAARAPGAFGEEGVAERAGATRARAPASSPRRRCRGSTRARARARARSALRTTSDRTARRRTDRRSGRRPCPARSAASSRKCSACSSAFACASSGQ